MQNICILNPSRSSSCPRQPCHEHPHHSQHRPFRRGRATGARPGFVATGLSAFLPGRGCVRSAVDSAVGGHRAGLGQPTDGNGAAAVACPRDAVWLRRSCRHRFSADRRQGLDRARHAPWCDAGRARAVVAVGPRRSAGGALPAVRGARPAAAAAGGRAARRRAAARRQPPQLTTKLEFFDLLVTYTEYGRNEVVKLRPDLKTKLKVVPHGNNSKDFYPLEAEEVKKFRDEYFGNNSDKFIVTNINRNQPRKDIPTTIFAFMEAKKIWPYELPEPFLYLHMHPKDPLGWDLRGILIQTDLVEDKDYKLLPFKFEESMAETEVLNQIYNASDAFLTTTLGEGWGLTFSEAAACKVPIVAPYTTSFMEMSNYGKNGYMLYNITPTCNLDNVIREQCDPIEIAEVLLEVAESRDTAEYKKKLEDNYNWVKKLEWKEVCKSWVTYFKTIY